MDPGSDNPLLTEDRLARVREVARSCLRRREAGEDLSDDDILSRHGDLLPELAGELRKLAMIHRAFDRADQTTPASSDVRLPGAAAETPAIPAEIPGYEILGEIHRGGQGVVYRARQHSTRRDVAIKVLRDGPFAGPNDRLRFEREARILAAFRHPNIVAIHDRGQAAGLHYFVMDYIQGQPLDRWARPDPQAPPRSIPQTLALFESICDAVSAAHMRGVIHRDLKPGNIRVDESGAPYVLDFGLAKLGADSSADITLAHDVTQSGQFVGSLPWASPEQATGRGDEIDTRSDVYALGVTLFQALTGEFPYRVRGDVRAVIDNIEHAAPANPRRLRPEIDDDLAAIVLKSLAKEPERRYQSVAELGRDLRRYQAGEAIEARRDSTLYVLRKLARRHRALTAIGALSLAIVLGAAVSAAWLARLSASLAQQRNVAQEAEKTALAARDAEHAAREESEQVSSFLTELLVASDPFERRTTGSAPSIADVLDEASHRIERELADQPRVAAAAHATIGAAYSSLGAFELAEVHLNESLRLREETLGPLHPDVADSLWRLAELAQARGQYGEGIGRCEQAIELLRGAGAARPADLARAFTLLAGMRRELGAYDAALDAADAALLALQGAEAAADLRGRALTERGATLRALGDFAAAENDYVAAFDALRDALGAEHAETIVARSNLASLWFSLGRFEEAEGQYRAALEGAVAALGQDNPRLARFHQNLGQTLMRLDRLDEAQQELDTALRLRPSGSGALDADAAETLALLGELERRSGRLAAAHEKLRQSLAIQRAAYGDDHPRVATCLYELAAVYTQGGEFSAAVPLLREAYEIRRRALPAGHPDTLLTMAGLAAACRKTPDCEAIELYEALEDLQRQTLGARSPGLAETLVTLGGLYKEQNALEQAEAAYRESLAIRRAALGDHPDVAWSADNLAVLLTRREVYDEAETLLREALELRRRHFGPKHILYATSLRNLARVFALGGEPGAAEPLLAEALAIFVETRGPAHNFTTVVRVDYAECLVALQRPAGAQTQLLAAWEEHAAAGINERQRQRLLTLLVDVHEQLGEKEAAESYRALLSGD